MKKLFVIILILIPSLCFGGIQDHPRFAELQSMVDSLITTIKNNQATHYAIHKQYFQGLQIPIKSEVICDGMTNEPIDIGIKPADQEATWKDFNSTVFAKKATLPFHIRVDVYKMPSLKWGWIFRAELEYDGDTWVYEHDSAGGGIGGPWDVWYMVPSGGPMFEEIGR